MTSDQPAGEGLSDHGGELTPWQFADTLARADLGLTGIGLEYRIGFHAGESIAARSVGILPTVGYLDQLEHPRDFVSASSPHGFDFAVQQQRAWLRDYGPTLLSKPTVQGLLWNRLSDPPNLPAEENGMGLLNTAGQPKPIVTVLRELKVKYGV